jgi:hypothetical protein
VTGTATVPVGQQAALFADWFCVRREESLTGPGDYLTADVAGEPGGGRFQIAAAVRTYASGEDSQRA